MKLLCFQMRKQVKKHYEFEISKQQITIDQFNQYQLIKLTPQMSLHEFPSSYEFKQSNKTQMNVFPQQIIQKISKECRICLNNIEQNDNKLISPCQCQGSMKHVHEKCIQQWLQVKALRDLQLLDRNNDGIQCELCKTKIKITLQISKRCKACNLIKEDIKEKIVSFLICLVGFILTLALVVYCFYQLGLQIKDKYQANITDKTITLASILLNGLLFAFFTYHLTGFFIYTKVQARFKNKQPK